MLNYVSSMCYPLIMSFDRRNMQEGNFFVYVLYVHLDRFFNNE
jgi:hypothetical protein